MTQSPDYTTSVNNEVSAGQDAANITFTVNGSVNGYTTTTAVSSGGVNGGCEGNIFNFQTDGNTLTVVESRRGCGVGMRRLSPIPPHAVQFPTVIEEPATPCYDEIDHGGSAAGGAGSRRPSRTALGGNNGGSCNNMADKEAVNNGCGGDIYKSQQQQPRRRLPSINANMVKNMPSRSFDSGIFCLEAAFTAMT